MLGSKENRSYGQPEGQGELAVKQKTNNAIFGVCLLGYFVGLGGAIFLGAYLDSALPMIVWAVSLIPGIAILERERKQGRFGVPVSGIEENRQRAAEAQLHGTDHGERSASGGLSESQREAIQAKRIAKRRAAAAARSASSGAAPTPEHASSVNVALGSDWVLTQKHGDLVLKNRQTGIVYGPNDVVPMPSTSYGSMPATEAALFLALSSNLSQDDETQLSNFRRMASR